MDEYTSSLYPSLEDEMWTQVRAESPSRASSSSSSASLLSCSSSSSTSTLPSRSFTTPSYIPPTPFYYYQTVSTAVDEKQIPDGLKSNPQLAAQVYYYYANEPLQTSSSSYSKSSAFASSSSSSSPASSSSALEYVYDERSESLLFDGIESASSSSMTSSSSTTSSLASASLSVSSSSSGSMPLGGASGAWSGPARSLSLPARPPPLSVDEWHACLDGSGRVVREQWLRERIFYGGVSSRARPLVWPYLLGSHDPTETTAQRKQTRSLRRAEFAAYRQQWQSITPAQEKRFKWYRTLKENIRKDVLRTDRTHPFFEGDLNPHLQQLDVILRTYAFFHFDLGYEQGMNDLLSPLLYVLRDEVETFWCFVGLMENLQFNFLAECDGIPKQLAAVAKCLQVFHPPLHQHLVTNKADSLIFCFRWILVIFKREFSYPETLQLWEILWSRHLCPFFHLFVVIALLVHFADPILAQRMKLEDIMQFVNDQACHIQLIPLLQSAEAIYRQAYPHLSKSMRAELSQLKCTAPFSVPPLNKPSTDFVSGQK